jgi:pimeloyl-ACP methyl ester carboxylesterase
VAAVNEVKKVQIDGLTLGYRESGAGPPVLLLHGWPTSSFLWRDVMAPIARANRVVAVDLPGFGASDKPVDVRYNFAFFERVLDLFLARLGIDELGLAVHDLGGPIGLHWLLHRPGRVTKLALLNTLVYPEFSDAVKEFIRACATPESSERLTSPSGLEAILRDGLADRASLSPEMLTPLLEPFRTPESRRALAAAGIGVERRGFIAIAQKLPSLRVPVRIIYGERDRLLPDVATTMARVKADLPHADMTAFPDRGHFIQLEAPEQVGELLATFFAG